MKSRHLLAIAALGALAALPALADPPVRARDSEARTFEIENPEETLLVIDNVFGRVRVSAHDRDRIEVRIDKTIRARSEAALLRARRDVSLEIAEEAGLIDFYVDGPFRSRDRRGWSDVRPDRGYRVIYDFEVVVPRGIQIQAKTVDGGDLEVSGVGDFEIANVNGGVRMTRIDGSGSVKTVNGPVHVEFTHSPARDSHFETINGDVEVFFPPGLSADLRLDSKFGELWSEFEVAPLAAKPPVTTVEGGRRIIRTDRGARVRIGSGGPQLTFETLNGDVLVRARTVDADLEETP